MQTAALRGLGRRGDVCDVASPQDSWRKRLHGRFNSRFCRRVIPVASPEDDPIAFAEAVVDLCSTGEYDAVLPIQMGTVRALLPYAKDLAAFTGTLLPTEDQFAVGFDKMRTIKICREFGIAYPDSVFLVEDSCIEDISASLGYPIVIKHRQNFGGSIGVRMVAEPSGFKPAIAELMLHTNNIQDLFVQEFLPGTLFDACVVAREGKAVRLVTQARRLMYPVSGGVGSILVTVDFPQLTEKVTHIVQALNWTGPIQLEFKWDLNRSEFSLIEINPRFWGTTGAWLREGVNFPAVAVDLAMGLEVAPMPRLPPNLRFKHLLGRMPASMIQLWRAKGFSALHDPVAYTRTRSDLDLMDPLPDLWLLLSWVKRKIASKGWLTDNSLPADLIPSFEKPIDQTIDSVTSRFSG